MFGHDPGRSFAQRDGCSSVTPLSAPTLAPKWYFPTPDATSASPTIVDGHVFIGDWSGNFYSFATDPPPGPVTPEWTFKVDDTSSVGFGRIVSSAAYAVVGHRKLVLFGGGATLYALDATTGAKVASVCVDPRVERRALRHTRRPGRDRVVAGDRDGARRQHVGAGGHGRAQRRERRSHRDAEVRVDRGLAHAALEVRSGGEGRLLRAGPVDANSGAGSSGCAGVWGSPAVDVAKGLVFFGTASCLNAAADTVGEHVWAVDLATGAHVWNYGPHSGATARYDDDFGGALNLLPGGRVGAGSKDGWYYALDERTGALAWKTQAGQPGHESDGFAVGGILASPAVGQVNGEPAVFVATAISTPNDTPLEDGPD